MRYFIIAVIIIILTWCGYWFFSANTQKTTMENWLNDRTENGWIADTSSIKIAGFPYRYDIEVKNLNLSDPENGWAWTVPKFRLTSLSYKPNHIIAVWPNEQKLSLLDQTIAIKSKKLRGSLKVSANTELAIQSARIEIEDAHLTSTKGWNIDVANAFFALKEGQKTEYGFVYETIITASSLIMSNLNPLTDEKIAPEFSKVTIDIVPVFDRNISKKTIEEILPLLTALKVKKSAVKWHDMEIQAEGNLLINQEGYPTGKINIKAVQWEKILDYAVAQDVIQESSISILKGILKLMAKTTGGKDEIRIPLTFANGSVLIGILPIGAAPKFRLPN